MDYIENLGVKFGWCVDEPHVWTLSSKENAKDVMGSPRHVYNAIFYNQLCRMASQTPFMIGTTATTNAEHTGLISVAGTMSFEVVNTKDNTFLDIKKLRDIFNSSEISSNKIVMSCGSSVSAASLALAYSLINDDYIPKIYIGSWTEFGKIK